MYLAKYNNEGQAFSVENDRLGAQALRLAVNEENNYLGLKMAFLGHHLRPYARSSTADSQVVSYGGSHGISSDTPPNIVGKTSGQAST